MKDELVLMNRITERTRERHNKRRKNYKSRYQKNNEN
jgi:hypothetical protein